MLHIFAAWLRKSRKSKTEMTKDDTETDTETDPLNLEYEAILEKQKFEIRLFSNLFIIIEYIHLHEREIPLKQV